jgi:hypothetical protein
MLQLENILELWNKDCQIDRLKLDDASLETPKLHSKYLQLYAIVKLQHKKLDLKYKTLLKHKFLWYNGKLSRSQMDDLGWGYDALNGLKILKGDMDKYYDSDVDIQTMQLQLFELKTVLDTLEEIINNVKWRHSTIKNALDFRRFESGA